MKLLICTQKVDVNDSVLGFFHRWVEEFSKYCEKVTVICLYEGKHSLPSNVRIFSLGKEKGGSCKTLRYIVMFYRYIWREKNEYDAVFVHMNPEYVVLGGIFWRLWNKRVALWYNHKKGGIRAIIAVIFSHIIFYVSSFAFMARFEKAKQMGAGIDTSQFGRNPSISRREKSILSLGRISPVKNVDIIIQALEVLAADGVSFHASIYGDPTERDKLYYDKIRAFARDLKERGNVVFHKGIPNHQTPEIYNEHEIFINMTPSGSFDKTILEAMASEMVIITCNESFRDILPEKCIVEEDNSTDLAQKLKNLLAESSSHKEEIGKRMRKSVIETHDIRTVVKSISQYLQGNV